MHIEVPDILPQFSQKDMVLVVQMRTNDSTLDRLCLCSYGNVYPAFLFKFSTRFHQILCNMAVKPMRRGLEAGTDIPQSPHDIFVFGANIR